MAGAVSVDGVKVALALPSYSGYIPVELGLVLSELSRDVLKYGVDLCIISERGNSLPMTARNSTLARFLRTDYEYIFWVDDDIIFTVNDFLQILALCITRKSVAATYCARQDDPVFFIKPLNNESIEYTEDGLIPARGCGMGFSCQHRSIIEPLLVGRDTYLDRDKTIVTDLFKTGVFDGKYWGEDMYYFNLLYQSGYPVYIHPTINLKHVGRKDYDHRLLTEKGDYNGCSS